MKFLMEFEVDNAFFHSEPYYNGKQKKETLDMSIVGMLVEKHGHDMKHTGELSRMVVGELKGGKYA